MVWRAHVASRFARMLAWCCAGLTGLRLEASMSIEFPSGRVVYCPTCTPLGWSEGSDVVSPGRRVYEVASCGANSPAVLRDRADGELVYLDCVHEEQCRERGGACSLGLRWCYPSATARYSQPTLGTVETEDGGMVEDAEVSQDVSDRRRRHVEQSMDRDGRKGAGRGDRRSDVSDSIIASIESADVGDSGSLHVPPEDREYIEAALKVLERLFVGQLSQYARVPERLAREVLAGSPLMSRFVALARAGGMGDFWGQDFCASPLTPVIAEMAAGG